MYASVQPALSLMLLLLWSLSYESKNIKKPLPFRGGVGERLFPFRGGVGERLPYKLNGPCPIHEVVPSVVATAVSMLTMS